MMKLSMLVATPSTSPCKLPMADPPYGLIGDRSDGTITNLHHIWDSNIPEKLVGGSKISFAQEWSTNLTSALKTGKYANDKASWLSGTDISDATSSSMIWARDSNAYVCTAVIPGGVSAVETGDLGGVYYDGVVDVVELQIAKGMC